MVLVTIVDLGVVVVPPVVDQVVVQDIQIHT